MEALAGKSLAQAAQLAKNPPMVAPPPNRTARTAAERDQERAAASYARRRADVAASLGIALEAMGPMQDGELP